MLRSCDGGHLHDVSSRLVYVFELKIGRGMEHNAASKRWST